MFDLKDFKKVAGTPTHTVLRHPQGHMITIEHGKIEPAHAKALQAMPMHLAEGGEADEPVIDRPLTEAENAPNTQAQVGQVAPGLNPMQQGALEQAQAGPFAGSPSPLQSTATAATEASNAPYNAVPGMPEMQAGIEGQAKALGAEGQQEATIYRNAAQTERDAMQTAQTELADMHQEAINIGNDIKHSHINPEHYMESQGAGSRVSTAIGLLLGGLGAGINHTSNPVADYLDKQIDRDLEAQRANVSTKQNLLSALEHQYGSRVVAENMFHAIRRNTLADQIGEAAATSKSPQAQAAAQMAMGKLKQEAIPYLQRATALKLQDSNTGDPAASVQFLVPKEHQKEVFHEIAQAENAKDIEGKMLSAFDQASQENTLLHRAGRLGFEPPSLKKMNALALPLIHDLEGRVNEFEQKTIQDLMPAVGDTDATVAAKRQGLQQFMDQKKAAPTAKGFGIDLNKSTVPQSLQQEALSNPLLSKLIKMRGKH